MWLHIRGVGEWTNRLYEYFEKQQEKLHNGEIPPLIPEKKTITNGNVENNNSNPIKKIQATITRSFSNRDPNRKSGTVQLVSFTNENQDGTKVKSVDETNRASCSNSGDFLICFWWMRRYTYSLFVDLITYNTKNKKIPEHKLHRLIFTNKAPLEKSLSMPDIQTKAKKRERLLV